MGCHQGSSLLCVLNHSKTYYFYSAAHSRPKKCCSAFCSAEFWRQIAGLLVRNICERLCIRTAVPWMSFGRSAAAARLSKNDKLDRTWPHHGVLEYLNLRIENILGTMI